MQRLISLFFLSSLLFVFSCSTTKPAVTDTNPPVETRKLEDVVVTAPKIEKDSANIKVPVFHGSRRLDNDLINTDLKIGFDIPKQEVHGKVTLTLKPYFYPQESVTLDAQNMTFHSVRLNGPNGPILKYHNTDRQIYIDLGRTYTRDETYKVYLEYTARPAEGPKGGSAAIQSNQGMFFIDPLDEDPDKPTQIWTQGETENNSRWIPTIDSPNERQTHQFAITVDSKFKTVSNGVFVRSENHPNGTRTDYWRMDIPHAPYLMMIAAGDYAVVRDKWNNIPIAYYVEPQYKDDAEYIFPHTKELLSFFSDILKLPYPWPKYDQIVVRDFVSGAMENTTAVTFQEFVNGTKRELMDQHQNELIVAHEMFHHWFGDYITTESWANITLNEGFANYSEYLWLEHEYGKDEADYHLYEQLEGYFGDRPYHPLINYHYSDREDMFDGHSYNKGGCTLHMLRSIVGDEAFFASLHRYLKTNALSPVEVDELRMAFEDELGEDFHWFFDQWYLKPGHPELEVLHKYDPATKTIDLIIHQTQKGDNVPGAFLLPLKVGIYGNGGKVDIQSIEMTAREQSFKIAADFEPVVVEVDPEGTLVGKINYPERTPMAWKEFYLMKPPFRSRLHAVQHYLQSTDHEGAKEFAAVLLEDPFWLFRDAALDIYTAYGIDPSVLSKIVSLAESDKNSSVRAKALKLLASTGDKKYLPIISKALHDDSLPFTITGAALSAIAQLAPEQAVREVKALENINNPKILVAIAEIYAQNPTREHLKFFEDRIKKVKGFEAVDFYRNYIQTVRAVTPEKLETVLLEFKNIATDMTQSPEQRLAATRALADFYSSEKSNPLSGKVKAYLDEIKEKETLKELKTMYERMF